MDRWTAIGDSTHDKLLANIDGVDDTFDDAAELASDEYNLQQELTHSNILAATPEKFVRLPMVWPLYSVYSRQDESTVQHFVHKERVRALRRSNDESNDFCTRRPEAEVSAPLLALAPTLHQDTLAAHMKSNAEEALEAFLQRHGSVLLQGADPGKHKPVKVAAEYPVYWPFGKHAQGETRMSEYETRVDAVYQLRHTETGQGPVFLVEYKCRMENSSGTQYQWTTQQAKENMARTYALKQTKDRRQAELNAWMFYLCTGVMVRHVLVVQSTRRRRLTQVTEHARYAKWKDVMKQHWQQHGITCDKAESVGGQCGVADKESPFACVACLAVDWGCDYMQRLIHSFAAAPYKGADLSGAFYADSRFVVPSVDRLGSRPWKLLYKSEFTQANICAMWMSHCLLGGSIRPCLREHIIAPATAPVLLPRARRDLAPKEILQGNIAKYRQRNADTDYAGDIVLSVSCGIVDGARRRCTARRWPAFPVLYTPYSGTVLGACYYWSGEPLQFGAPAKPVPSGTSVIIRPEAAPSIQFEHPIASGSEPSECRAVRLQINEQVLRASQELAHWLQQEFPAADLERLWHATTRGIYQRSLQPAGSRTPEFSEDAPYGPLHPTARFAETAFARCIHQRLLRAALALGGTQLTSDDQLRFPHCSQRTAWTKDALSFVTARIFGKHSHNMIHVAQQHVQQDVRDHLVAADD